MKNLVLAAAVTTALSSLPMGAHAAGTDDLAQVREQLRGLMQRVDKLETENENLEAQDDSLKAETRGLRKESAAQSMEVAKVKGAEWAGKAALTGDIRYRHEAISDETLNAAGVQGAADRYRDRIRARLNAIVKAADNITVGIGMATAEGGDPRSSNQSLSGVFSRKSLDLDTAYFDWKFASWANLIGGKMKQPFVKPGQSLFWDNDINPEGVAVNFAGGVWFGTAYHYWINENSGAESTVTADAMLHGLQVGARLPIGSGTLLLAAHYYDLSAGQGRAPFFGGNSNGNTVINIGTVATPVNVLIYDYEVANVSAEFNTLLGDDAERHVLLQQAQCRRPDRRPAGHRLRSPAA